MSAESVATGASAPASASASASAAATPSSSTISAASSNFSLIPHIRTTKVSSVLNDSREFGKQNLFDGHSETCWNSAQGTPQFIQLSFTAPIDLAGVHLTFQGGFVGKSLVLSCTNTASPKKFLPLSTFEPIDNNTIQKFMLSDAIRAEAISQGITNLKITFPSSTDFYGRITIYALDIIGRLQAGSTSTPATDNETNKKEEVASSPSP